MEDTEWRPVEGLAERGGGQWRDWQRGMEDTEWREGWRTLSGGQWRD
ncbi:unnamed protein product [Staurois parvus]|uniref:Uncharacterized protein n=1 Tax=Staurois parvus TaxID=386267 RepID=A0ABN9G7L4_9NEOB|nr:unnamed protein product [Staurois parvus]